jgi:replicative DNA helicase
MPATNPQPKSSRNGQPPQNLEAEMAVIGSVLVSPSPADTLDDLPLLESDWFYADAHRLIWEAIQSLRRSTFPIDAVTVATELDRRKQFEQVGGVKHFTEIMATVPNSSHAAYYAALVASSWKSRIAVYGCREVLEVADTGSDDEIAAKAEAVLRTITERYNPEVDVSIRDVMVEAWAEIQSRIDSGQPHGTATGFADLDELLIGLGDGELVIVAARPGVGKSAFATCLSLNLGKRGIPSVMISLEMTKLEWSERLLSIESGVSGRKLKNCMGLDTTEREILLETAGKLSKMPLRIDDRPSQRFSSIAATARRAKRKENIGMLLVDYLQLVQPDLPPSNNRPREQEVASITKSLKILAKELGIPIVVLAQMNRNIENREDKRPRLADLRESGSIEQDADKVLFLHRPSDFEPEERPGEIDVICAKNRNGQTGIVSMAWMAACTRFADLARGREAAIDAASRAFPSKDWTV